MFKTLPCTDCVLFIVPYAGRLGGRKGLLSQAGLNQTPTACILMRQPVTVSGTRNKNEMKRYWNHKTWIWEMLW